MSFYSGTWNLLFATNFRNGHFAHIDFNTVHFLYSVVLNKCTLGNLPASSKTSVCWSINIEGYLSHYVGMTACIVSVPIWLRFWFVFDVTFTLVIFSELDILRAYVDRFSLYIYICNIVLSYTNLCKWLCWFEIFFYKGKDIFCYLEI